MPFDWGGAAGGGQDALQTMLEQRILQEKMALLQRQQQAEEAHRAAVLAQEAQQYERTQGFEEGKYKDPLAVRGRTADVEGKETDTSAKRYALTRSQQRDPVTDQIENELMADPNVGPSVKFTRIGVPTRGYNTQLGEEQKFGAEESEKDRAAMIRAANIRAAASGDDGVSDTRKAIVMGQIQSRLQAATRDYRSSREAINMMTDAAAEIDRLGPNDPAGQTILVKYQKILDAQSVVRESEYLRTQEGQALASRIQGAWERLSKGGPGVSAEALKGYVAMAKQFHNRQIEYAREQRELAGRQADFVGIPRNLVMTEDKDLDAPAGGGGGGEGTEAIVENSKGQKRRALVDANKKVIRFLD